MKSIAIKAIAMKSMVGAALSACMLAGTGMAQAATYNFNFPSYSSNVVSSVGALSATDIGYFWSVSHGDQVSETFSGSGLFGATSLDLELNITQNVLSQGASVDWDVLVNGVDVGDWTWTSTSGTGMTYLSYTFAAISGEFNSLALIVKNEVPAGLGSIALGLNTEATVSNSVVPEPDTLGFLLAGLAVISLVQRKRA
ncbi:PEP-CTERM sorting domain-containing protein [Methylophilus sp. 5]|uniref:PEP-CTERM sorting domain-containing protein n=1 Tax=Methylophilus sp. 5 TaxID=1112274 RepID=UPI0004B2EB58|nr:PEP-CTERM sorting domain-containing protein [Methylophilus sp. 5]